MHVPLDYRRLSSTRHTRADEHRPEIAGDAWAKRPAHTLEGVLGGGAARANEDIEVAHGIDEALAEFRVVRLELFIRKGLGFPSKAARTISGATGKNRSR